MIPRDLYKSAADIAYEDIRSFCGHAGSPSQEMLSDIVPNMRALQAAKFAQAVQKIHVIPFAKLPKEGFASWLMSIPQIRIAVADMQLAEWEQSRRGPVADVQKARTIIHEVGHARVQPALTAGATDQRGFVPSCRPEDEERAWVYAMSIMAIVLGDYAKMARRRLGDDTPSVVV